MEYSCSDYHNVGFTLLMDVSWCISFWCCLCNISMRRSYLHQRDYPYDSPLWLPI